jgi:8-oxo-dGTP diphosphatase
LEENETLAMASVREASEEIGVIINPSDLIFSHILHVRANIKNTQDIIGFYFIAEKWTGTPSKSNGNL